MRFRAKCRAARRRIVSFEHPHRSERGDTLIEVLMTLVVLSIAVLGIIIAFSTSLSASVDHRNLAANDVVLRSTAETALSQIQQQSSPLYVSCATATPPTPSYVSANNFGAPPGYTASVSAVTYWNKTTNAFDPTETQSACLTNNPNSPELITLTVTNISSGVHVWTNLVVDDRSQNSANVLSVTAVSPSSLGAGGATQTIAITGTNFVSGATVSFSGTGITVFPATYTYPNSTTIDVSVSVSGAATAGTRTITVTNPDTTSATSGAIFTVLSAFSVTSVGPSSLVQGQSNQTLTVTGTGFVSGATVSLSTNGVTVNSTTFSSATQLIVNVSIASAATAGTRTITVTNPDTTSATSGAIFTVKATSTVLNVLTMVGSGNGTASKWDATVTVDVEDSNGFAISGVLVTGTWGPDNVNSVKTSCTTTSGSCSVVDGSPNKLGSGNATETFTVSSLSATGYTYNSAANFASPATASVSQP